jgi:hypothetical protein
VALTANGLNSDEFKLGGLHEKHAVATWELENRLSIRLKTEENHENLCRDGGSQELPYAHTDF